MNRFRKSPLAAAAIALITLTLPAAPALALTYNWVSGSFVPGITAPNPLLAPDVLTISTGSNKTFGGPGFTNDSLVNWQAGTVFMGGGASVFNNGLWDSQGDTTLTATTGGGSFTNNGTLRKRSGIGATTVSAGVGFTNNGSIDVQTGTLRLAGTPMVFNTGTVFTGAGVVQVASAATFNGSFSSSNLVLAGGTQTGAGAVLHGAVGWREDTLSGTWQVAAGQTLNAISGSNKTIAGTGTVVTNAGTVNWQAGTVFMGGGAGFVNNGLLDSQGDTTLAATTGGGSVTNNGTLRKSGGTGATTVSAGVGFTNNGSIDVQTGSLRLAGTPMVFNAGTVFTGAGVVQVASAATFNGSFSSSNLVLAGGTQTGAGAVLHGAVGWREDTLSGTWQVAAGQTLNAISGSNKSIAGTGTVVTNAGTVNWQAGTVFMGGGAGFVNNGLLDSQGDTTLAATTGGGSFTNNGTLRKSGGTGATSIAAGVGFSNQGLVDVQVGTIALPLNFTNTGTLNGDGRYTASGVLTNNGTVAPGSSGAGTLRIASNYTQGAAGILALDVSSLASFDLLAVTGAANLGGTLALNCLAACSFDVGDSFVVLTTTGTRSGTFSGLALSGFGSGAFEVDYTSNSVSLRVTQAVTAVPEPGSDALLLAGLAALGWAVRRRAA